MGPWQVATRDDRYVTHDEYAAGLQAFRRQYGLAPNQPVWVLSGGWDPVAHPPDKDLPFTRAIRIFRDDSR